MTETPLILGPGKSGVISLKCKLGGSHILKEEDILLLKTFMNSMSYKITDKKDTGGASHDEWRTSPGSPLHC